MARSCPDLLAFFVSSVLTGVADAAYCYTRHRNGRRYYHCEWSAGSIAGAVIGILVGVAVLIGLLVFFCYIRPRRKKTRRTLIQTPVNPYPTVVSTSTEASIAQMGSGYLNTVSYSPGAQDSYPQHTFPPRQPEPSTGYRPILPYN